MLADVRDTGDISEWIGAMLRGRTTAAITILLFAIVIYFDLTGMPWPAMLLICSLAGWRIGGPMLGVGTLMGLGFIVVTGTWPEAMLSLYLCGIAVALSFGLGTTIGTCAAHNDTLSAIVRPINGTLHAMQLFVILIPFVMIFKIGDFTARLAIIAIIADRMTHAWSRKRQRELGLRIA